MNNEKVKEYITKIIDFAYAITLDEDSVSEGIALTMVKEIQSYGIKILDIVTN